MAEKEMKPTSIYWEYFLLRKQRYSEIAGEKSETSIIGYEEIDISKQKPDPNGLITCIREICNEKCEIVLYIGDHETDIICAVNAAIILKKTKIIPIAANYGMQEEISSWKTLPKYILQHPSDLLEIIKKLPI